jgi:hypothetical protein
MTVVRMRKVTTAIAITGILVGLGWAGPAPAQSPAPGGGNVPAALQPPADAVAALHAKGQGVQIYACSKDAGSGAASWKLKGPEAVLYDDAGKPIGKHFAGPSWQANDGSTVVGEAVAHADAPGHTAIPWLLLKAKSHEGSGTFADITYVQRLDTAGGLAPTAACDPKRDTAERRVAYTAIYVFFRGNP